MDRAARQAAALRDNLKRRKAQQKARREPVVAPDRPGDASAPAATSKMPDPCHKRDAKDPDMKD